MAIQIQCPNPACRAGAAVPDSLDGKSVKCKRCGTAFVARPTADARQSDTRPVSPGDDPFPALPAAFGRYRVLRLLGKGGMGAVYLAEDTELGRKVALKLPSFGPGAPPTRVDRFLREARAAAALHHPHICTIFDVGREAGRPFLTMAYVEGRPLAEAIDIDKPMPERQAATLARQLALALAHAHDRGVIHRDLKPANVMLTAGGDPVVMDFGLAKRLAEEDTESKLTREGAVIGTPSYMAPEQVRGESAAIGPRTDVYALGAMLYELLTGRPPFEGPVGVVLANVLTGKVPSVKDVRRDVDPRLDAACRKAMAKDPADRFPTLTAFAEALAEYLNAPVASPALPPTITEARPDLPPLPPTLTKETRAPLYDLKVVEPKKPRARRFRMAIPERWGLWAGIGGMVLAAVVVVVVLLSVRTRYGEVVIELSDPAARVEVKVDGERIDIPGPDRPISLKAGEHGLTVTGPDFETVTHSFKVNKGEREMVKVTLISIPRVGKRDGQGGGAAEDQTDHIAPGADTLSQKERDARDKAIAWLKNDQAKWGGDVGDWERVGSNLPTGGATALALLALLENGVGPDDPVVARGLKYLRGVEVEPRKLYVVALQTQVYCAANQPEDSDRIRENVRWLEGSAGYDEDKKLLGWSYEYQPAGRADVSCTRYAVAALHAANRAGYPPANFALWSQVRDLFARTQQTGGGWRYCATDPAEKEKPPTHTMTANGVLCMVLAAQAMPPADPEADPVVAAGLDWLARNFRLDGPWAYYNLDVLAALGRARGEKKIGSGAAAHDWFQQGSELLLRAQQADGRFVGSDEAEKNPVIATAFALRFLASKAAGQKAAAGDFVPLFNGQDLTGWKGLPAFWRAEGGAVVGTLPFARGRHTYLCTKAEYKDFELSFRVRLKDGVGNSGVQIRSTLDDPDGFVVTGPQVDIGGTFWGSLYGEGFGGAAPGQGKTMRQAPEDVVRRVLKPDDFNAMSIRVVGKHVTITLNGETTVDDEFPELPGAGIIALQLHRGEPLEVTFADVKLRDLTSRAAAAPLGKAELIALSELPAGQNKSGPWLSADGRSLYWADKQGSVHRIWRADRPGPGQSFEAGSGLFAGHDLTVSADMTEVILVDHDAAAGEEKFALFAGKKGRPTDAVFGSWRKLDELAKYASVFAPCLSADGLTLYAEQFGDKSLPPNVRFRRADRDSPWGKAEAVPISGLIGKGSLRFPFISPDGRYLFGNNDVSPSGMVMLTSSDGGKTFGSPRAIEVPGVTMKGKFPRYVPESNELFFGEWPTATVAELYVIRNFDPERDTRPVK